jgi:hypothetical protein
MPYTFTSRLRVLIAAIVALAVLALPATAPAKPKQRDRNHDGIADKWAKKHKLGKGKGVAKKDPDSDGLTNLGEFRAKTHPRKPDTDGDGVGDANEDGDGDSVDHENEAREGTHPNKADTDRDGTPDGTEDADSDKLNNAGEDASGNDPINPDSDEDGVEDGEEGAGRVAAFDGTTLTIELFNGGSLTGQVDEFTSVWCDGGDLWGEGWEKSRARVAATSDEDDEDYEDEDESWDDEDEEYWDDEDYEDEGDDAGDWEDGECSIEDLAVGQVVRGASLEVEEDGTWFWEIEVVLDS